MISFPRLDFYAVTLLKYSRRESRYLTIGELTAQYEEYCAYHGMKQDDYRDMD